MKIYNIVHIYFMSSHLTMFVSLHRCLYSRSLRFCLWILIRLCCHLLTKLLTLRTQHDLTRDTCQIRPILFTYASYITYINYLLMHLIVIMTGIRFSGGIIISFTQEIVHFNVLYIYHNIHPFT